MGVLVVFVVLVMVFFMVLWVYSFGGLDLVFISIEDLNCKENLEQDFGDDNSNDLLFSCLYFCNEIGGECECNVSFFWVFVGFLSSGEGYLVEFVLSVYCINVSILVLEVFKEQQWMQSWFWQYSIEYVDLGVCYYQDYFVGKEYVNYFGVDEKLGLVVVSIKWEKLEDYKEYGFQYQYRIIFWICEFIILWGFILEDVMFIVIKYGIGWGLFLKDVLEYVIFEFNIYCLWLVFNIFKVME